MDPAIKIESLSKAFRTGLRRRKSLALKNLDLQVSAGEVFGFLGPNGAGKTTTIKILVGLLKADTGAAYLFGQPSTRASSRKRIAYLPELPNLYDYLTPAEFLIHCGRLSDISASNLKAKIPGILERVGLDPGEKRQLRKFSKGMLQRIGIAQTLLADPDLYILVEPMGGLDPLGRRWVKDLIHELGKAGKTVFFSSHVLAEAEAVCNRVAFMHQGKLVAEGSLAEILEAQQNEWEIVVNGTRLLEDRTIIEKIERVERAGHDSRVLIEKEQSPDSVLAALLDKGYTIKQVERRHSSLEEVFIGLVSKQGEDS